MLKRLLLSFLNLAVGLALGLLLLEAVLWLNPRLLLRGMGVPAPIDAPLVSQHYVVRYSDADLFFWHTNLIRPIEPGQDMAEAEVHFQTDEFGFANAGPLPPRADIVVLGRSYSLGAQAAMPWPRLVAEQSRQTVVNLSQAAAGVELKRSYLRRFGLPRKPKWIVVEVLPSMDVLGYSRSAALLLPQLPVPLIQAAARAAASAAPDVPASYIYPLPVSLPAGSLDLTFFSYYLAALTIDAPDLEASQDWQAYGQGLLSLARDARAEGACVALLYAPTKEEIYVSAAEHAPDLAPALRAGWNGWRLGEDGWLAQDAPAPERAELMAEQAGAARNLVAGFAAEHGLLFIDPTPGMAAAVQAGERPFMVYDTHWSAAGHAIVADSVTQALKTAECR